MDFDKGILSPYLFLFVSDVLALLIQKAMNLDYIEGIQISLNSPSISHLFFADDTLIFLQANQQCCRNIVQILNAYCAASCQQVSLNKSSVFQC